MREKILHIAVFSLRTLKAWKPLSLGLSELEGSFCGSRLRGLRERLEMLTEESALVICHIQWQRADKWLPELEPDEWVSFAKRWEAQAQSMEEWWTLFRSPYWKEKTQQAYIAALKIPADKKGENIMVRMLKQCSRSPERQWEILGHLAWTRPWARFEAGLARLLD